MTARARLGWALLAVTVLVIHARVLDDVAGWFVENWHVLIVLPMTFVIWWWMEVTEDRP